jgi:hypothetical protein
MYNNTNGSLLIAMLAHLRHNLAASLVPAPADGGRQHLIVAVICRVMAMVAIVWTEVANAASTEGGLTPRAMRTEQDAAE